MKPKVAFFDFTSCEGCQLEVVNFEQEVLQLLNLLDIVNFRELMTERSDDYDIAIIDGAISTDADVARIKEIRERASILITIGACSSLGGVNCLKNAYPMEEVLSVVYGDAAGYYNTIPARPVSAVVPVDYALPQCPVNKAEFLEVVKALLLGKKPEIPNYPVCAECKMAENACVFDLGRTCLGPVTRAGCNALCVTWGRHCWGCRGLVDDPNVDAATDVLKEHGLTAEDIVNKFRIYTAWTGGSE